MQLCVSLCASWGRTAHWQSGLPLISSASHLAFFPYFLILLFHGCSYRHHREKGLFLTMATKAGKEERLTLKWRCWLGETAMNPFKHLTLSILTAKCYLPLHQTGRQVNVNIFPSNKLKNSNPQPIFYFTQLLFPCLYMSIFTSSTTSWIIYFPWSISLSEKSLQLGIWQFVADIHLY